LTVKRASEKIKSKGVALSNHSRYSVSAVRRFGRIPFGVLKTAKIRLREKFITIPTNIITDQFAFSFSDSGWHFFREIIAAYENNPEIGLHESAFFQFFKLQRIQSVRYLNDLLFLHDHDRRAQDNGYKFYFGTYPWGEWGVEDDLHGPTAWGHHYDFVEGKMTRDLDGYRRNPWYQPGDEYPLEIEWKQSIRVYNSLKRGYRPIWFGTYPEVVLLKRNNGEMRAVVAEGQHRMAILSQLGYKELLVMITRHSMRIIHEADADRWYYVRRGLCSKKQALGIFNAFFELNGRERAEYLNLKTAY